VQQQQNIALSSCAKFSVTSDGTKEGTEVHNGGFAGENTCPRVQETPIPMNGIAFWKNPSSIQRPQAGVTGMYHILQSNGGSRGGTSKTTLFVAILIALLAMLPGAYAAPENHQQDKLRERAEWHIQEVSDRVKLFAQDISNDLAEKVTAQGLNGDVFAHNLVANVVSSVCSEYFKGAKSNDFTLAIVQNCVKSVYSEETFALPAVQFSAVFGASLLCGYIVSEAYPVAQEFHPHGCYGLQELVRKVSPETSMMMLEVITSITLQTSRPLAHESALVQSPGSSQFEALLESPTHLSVSHPSDLTPSRSPTGLLNQNQASSLNMDSTTNNPLQNSATSRSAFLVSSTPGANKLASVSVSRILSPVISTPSLKSFVVTKSTMSSQLSIPSKKEGTPPEATRSLSETGSSTSRSHNGLFSHTASENSYSASSKASLDISPSSQSTAASSSLRPSFPMEFSGSEQPMLSDGVSMKSRRSTTYLEQTSPPKTTARPAFQGTGSTQSVSQSSANIPTRATKILVIAPYTSSSNSHFGMNTRTKSSPVLTVATSSLETDLVSVLGDDLNAVSLPTVQSYGRASTASTVPSSSTLRSYDNSTTTTTPVSKPVWQAEVESLDVCPGLDCTSHSTQSAFCDDCQSESHASLMCSSSLCPSTGSEHVVNKTSKLSATGHSSTFRDLPKMLYSSKTSSPVLTVSSIPRKSTTPVQPNNSSGLGPSSALPVLQSLAEKPTAEPKGAGGFIAKGFEGWW
jgi:hypothetical protein